VLKLHHVRREDYLDRLSKDTLRPDDADIEALAKAEASANAENDDLNDDSPKADLDQEESSLHG
jgi:hypothetical protein